MTQSGGYLDEARAWWRAGQHTTGVGSPRGDGAVCTQRRKEVAVTNYTHLCEYPDGASGSSLLIVSEDFCDDFSKACDAMLDDLSVRAPHLLRMSFLEVAPIPSDATAEVKPENLPSDSGITGPGGPPGSVSGVFPPAGEAPR